MKIAIIGAGNVGKALATSSVRAGHHVTLSAANPAHAAEAAQATGANAATSNVEAVKDAEGASSPEGSPRRRTICDSPRRAAKGWRTRATRKTQFYG